MKRSWKSSGTLFLVTVVIVAASIGLRAGIALSPYIAQPTRDLTDDRDWGYLNKGLNRIHDFSDTGRWWTGTWCGEVPFWRPLASYVFWGMRLLWPKEYMLPREIILVALHLLFVGVAGLLLWRLTRRPWLVLLSLWLFAGFKPSLVRMPHKYVSPVVDLLSDPKNIPDPLVGLAILASLLFVLDGKWLAGLVAASVSIGFKEVGFTTWPLVVLVLGWIYRDRVLAVGGWKYVLRAVKRNWAPVVAWMAVIAALAAIHFLTVGIGFREGKNDFWLWRVALCFGWPVFFNLFYSSHTPALIACLLFVSMLILRRSSIIIRTLAILASFAIGIMFYARYLRTTWDVAAVAYSFDPGLGVMALCIIWLSVVWTARRDWKTIVFGVLISFIAAIPSWMAAQTWAHTRYVSEVFLQMAAAAVLCENARVIASIYLDNRTPHGSATARPVETTY